MQSPTPSTPEHNTPRRAAVLKRAFTVPPRLQTTANATNSPEIGAAEGIETLYVHPSASIVKFSTSSLSRPSSSSGSPRARDQVAAATLPWRGSSETTLAVGPLEIYRVPGSVSFLHSGALLHAILPRSQCWCVDGVSRFALRVLPDTYYRIELPSETPEDLEAVESLKATLSKVLFYEKTPCPFARGFTVPLPENEIEVRKTRKVSSGPAKKWRQDRAYSWRPEGDEEYERASRQGDPSSAGVSDEESADVSDDEEVHTTPQQAKDKTPDAVLSTPVRTPLRPPGSARSVTAPITSKPRSPLPSSLRSRFEDNGILEVVEEVKPSAGPLPEDPTRLRTYQVIPTDMPPSPPDSSVGAEPRDLGSESSGDTAEPAEPQSEEEQSLDLDSNTTMEDSVLSCGSSRGESLVTPEDVFRRADAREEIEPSELIYYGSDSLPRSLAKLDIAFENVSPAEAAKLVPSAEFQSERPTASLHRQLSNEDPFAAIQARIQARRSIGGTTSFLPRSASATRKSHSSTSSSATLSSLSTTSSRTSFTHQQRSMASALVTKGLATVFGPPAHLVQMMLTIAARFVNGTFGNTFLVESPAGSRIKVPGSFHVEEVEDELEEWEEDDFGVPLRSPVRLAGVRERGGWELD